MCIRRSTLNRRSVYGPGPSSNVSASSRCWVPALITAGVYESVLLIAAFSSARCSAANECEPSPASRLIVRRNPTSVDAAAGRWEWLPADALPAISPAISATSATTPSAAARRRRSATSRARVSLRLVPATGFGFGSDRGSSMDR